MADDVNINVEENINPQDIQAPVDVNVEPTEVTDNGIGIGNISNNSFDSNMFIDLQFLSLKFTLLYVNH